MEKRAVGLCEAAQDRLVPYFFQFAHKLIFLYQSLPKLPHPLPPPEGRGDFVAVLHTAAAKDCRLLKPISMSDLKIFLPNEKKSDII